MAAGEWRLQSPNGKQKGNSRRLRIRLAVWFTVQDEARFLSHQDMMRLMERALARAKIPVKFSQGFNPRPQVTLPVPRPVGVSSQAEVLVMELAEAADPADVLARLKPMMPDGVDLTRCQPVQGMLSFQPESIDFVLELDAPRIQAVRQRIEELAGGDSWPWIRQSPKTENSPKTLDLKPMIRHLALAGTTLAFTLVAVDQRWARAEEVLGLLGLDEVDLSRLVRTEVRWAQGPDNSQSPAQ